ncbi:SH3 domain-containing protein [Streptomyces sp. NPDC020799]|uniref:SH3 domain-containing protein n=1 Tax=Streptomyces sp. NPDC020799 TaxID=3365091 RepID=UPI00378B2313
MSDIPEKPYGTVVAQTGVNLRQYPSTDSKKLGSLEQNTRVGLRCKVRAQLIQGNEIWYKLRDRDAWVSARWVENTGTVSFCQDM